MNRPPDDEVILAVELTQFCKAFHVLPRAGGVLDQDYYIITLLRAGLRAFDKKEQIEVENARREARSGG